MLCIQTVAHEFLEIESEIRNVREGSEVLEDILRTAWERINPRESPELILEAMDNIFILNGFQYKYNDNYLLSDYLQARTLTCGEYSVLYASMAELFHLPLFIVLAPRHSFVRWQEGQNSFNWETTVQGYKQRNDGDYILSRNIHEEAIKRGVYLQNLTRTQAHALAYNNRGWVKDTAQDFRGAFADFSIATQMHPSYAKAFLNRGYVLEEMGETRRAIEDYTRVILLDPNHAIAHKNRARARRAIGDSVGAAQDFEKGKELEK